MPKYDKRNGAWYYCIGPQLSVNKTTHTSVGVLISVHQRLVVSYYGTEWGG